jgi:hypothetical protein
MYILAMSHLFAIISRQEYLKSRISSYFKEKKIETTVKYIDPSYMIRYAPPLFIILFISMLFGVHKI